MFDEGVVVFRGYFVFFLHNYYDQSKTCVENTNDAFLSLISNDFLLLLLLLICFLMFGAHYHWSQFDASLGGSCHN